MRLTSILLAFAIIMGSFEYSGALTENYRKPVVIILVNRLSLEDIDNMDNFKGIVQREYIALMNTRANKLYNDYSSALTIGAGAKADAHHSISKFVEATTENIGIYKRRTGNYQEKKGLINLNIARIYELNKENYYNPYIGNIGSEMGKLNKKVVTIGNSDIENYDVALGPLIIMDEFGLVDYGDISKETIILDNTYPYGYKTNYEYLFNKFIEYKDIGELIVIELGDLFRLESYRDNLTEEMFLFHRNAIIKEIDDFIFRVYNYLSKENHLLMIINPFPSIISQEKGEKLTPFILINRDKGQGILTSNTTRRMGIIANIDISSFIINYFGGDMARSKGSIIDTVEYEENLQIVREISKKAGFISKNRIFILSTFALYEIFVAIFAFIGIQLYSRRRFNIKFAKFLLLSNMAIPFAMLILPLFDNYNLIHQFILIIIIAIAITIISMFSRKNKFNPIIIIGGLMTFSLVIDIILDSKLIKYSYLGYCPIIGARYYGIGNEYLGILLGSSIIFSFCLIERFKVKRSVICLFFILISIIIGFPSLGANVGGAITAAFGYTYLVLRLNKPNIRIKDYLYIFVSAILFLIFLSLTDLYFLNRKTHLANALISIRDYGIIEAINIIKRKLSMNIRLLGVSIWGKVLLSSLLVFGILFYRPFGILKRVFDKYRNIYLGIIGILISSIVGFAVNDSGVVTAATATIYLLMPLMYIVYDELEELKMG